MVTLFKPLKHCGAGDASALVCASGRSLPVTGKIKKDKKKGWHLIVALMLRSHGIAHARYQTSLAHCNILFSSSVSLTLLMPVPRFLRQMFSTSWR
jgi:hypothetical protein